MQDQDRDIIYCDDDFRYEENTFALLIPMGTGNPFYASSSEVFLNSLSRSIQPTFHKYYNFHTNNHSINLLDDYQYYRNYKKVCVLNNELVEDNSFLKNELNFYIEILFDYPDDLEKVLKDIKIYNNKRNKTQEISYVHQNTTSIRKILCYALLSIILLVDFLATPAIIGLGNMHWKFKLGFDTTNKCLLTMSLIIIGIGISTIAICAGLICSTTRCYNMNISDNELKFDANLSISH